MADKKSATQTIYNTADGPRSIMGADGTAVVIPAGGSADFEPAQGELDSLHPDLTTTKPKNAAEPAASGPSGDATADQQAKAVEELATDLVKGNDADALAKLAKAEKVTVADDATPEQTAIAIAQKRLGVEAK